MHRLRFVSLALVAATFALAAFAQPAAASTTGAVISVVHQFVDGFNVGNTKSALAACASPASIIDDFPPHEWHGPTACADWANAYGADAGKHGITDGIVTLGSPWHADVDGDRAYVVVPATYAYKQHGKPVTITGNVWTFVLRKFASGWRITSWAWALH